MDRGEARSDHPREMPRDRHLLLARRALVSRERIIAHVELGESDETDQVEHPGEHARSPRAAAEAEDIDAVAFLPIRSEEHTSELQSLMRISYAVFCLKK